MPTSPPPIDAHSLRLPAGQFVADPQPKDLLVLHHTAGGSAASSFRWWRDTPERIATAYIIGRDGTVFECFDPSHWAWHLGTGITALERRSIGIELANWGPLTKKDGRFLNWAGREIAPDAVYSHDAAWRGHRHFEAYPEAQIEAALQLAVHLVERFGMDPDVAPGQWGTPDTSRFRKFRGVIAHHHVRHDKTDISPAFPWDRLTATIEGDADPDVLPPTPDVPDAPAPPAFEGLLGLGDDGPRVVALQRRLAELGYDVGPADGDFGPRTLVAVLRAQADRGLPADGIVGALTAQALGLA